jgi:hypothetical protein
MNGQTALHKLQMNCVMTLTVSVLNYCYSSSSINKDSANPSLNFEFADKEAIDCVLKAIDQHQQTMSPSLQQNCDAIKPQLETKKAEFRKW